MTITHSYAYSACTNSRNTSSHTFLGERGQQCAPLVLNTQTAILDKIDASSLPQAPGDVTINIFGIFLLFPMNNIPINRTQMSFAA